MNVAHFRPFPRPARRPSLAVLTPLRRAICRQLVVVAGAATAADEVVVAVVVVVVAVVIVVVVPVVCVGQSQQLLDKSPTKTRLLRPPGKQFIAIGQRLMSSDGAHCAPLDGL